MRLERKIGRLSAGIVERFKGALVLVPTVGAGAARFRVVAANAVFRGMKRAPRFPGRASLAELETRPFVKVMPRDFKRVLQAEAKARAEHREPEFAELVGAGQ